MADEHVPEFRPAAPYSAAKRLQVPQELTEPGEMPAPTARPAVAPLVEGIDGIPSLP
jgi:hypothetical protein